MNVGTASAVLAAIVCLTIAIAIVLRRPMRPLFKHFAAFTFALSLWHASAFVASISGAGIGRWQAAAALLLPPLALRFFRELLRDRSSRGRRAQRATVIVSLALLGVDFSPWGDSTAARLPMLAYVVAAMAGGLHVLWQHVRRAPPPHERTRLSYVFYGGLLAAVLALGELLPGHSPAAALGHVAVTFYVYFLYQSVIARRLIDLVELLGKAAVLAVLTLVLASVYAVLVVWVGSGQQGLWLFNTLVASFVILILFDQVRPWVEETTAKLLFRERYELGQAVRRLLRRLRTTISIEALGEQVLDALQTSGRAAHATMYLAEGESYAFYLVGHRGDHAPPRQLTLGTHTALLQQLRRVRRPLLIDQLVQRQDEISTWHTGGDPILQRELERANETIRAMRAVEASVVLPMLAEDRIAGLLMLGTQTPSDAYSADELTLLLSVAEACAVVVENSHEYEKRRERDRLVAIGEMATGIAHEIRNPLGAIKGAAQCLDPGTLSTESQEFVDVILEEVDRLNSVVGQFLEYARPWRGNPEPTDVNEVIAATVRLLAHDKQPAGVELTQDLALGLPRVSIDPEQLKQVLINLLLNAFQAMPGGGKVLIKTEIKLHDETVDDADPMTPRETATSTNPQRVVIKVRDNGEGIAPDAVQHIFVPFFTTKHRGTGLGLPISQRIIENAGGRIEVKSAPGQGTSFAIRLPPCAPTTATTATTTAASAQSAQSALVRPT